MYKTTFSKNKAYHTALVIIPPSELCSKIQSIRKIYDSAYDRWMPHINLCFPFIPTDEFDCFTQKFSEIFKEIPCFEIKFSDLGHFDHAKKSVLWANPQTKNDEIKEIYKIITKELSFLKEDRDFNPHLTLGQFEKTSVLAKKEEFLKEWKEIVFEVKEIHLIQRDGQHSPFYIKNSIKLKE